MSFADAEAFLSENYLAYLLLGVLLTVMHAYRDVKLPADSAFRWVAAALFIMCVANSVERVAILSPDRVELRMLASVVHYTVQPVVIYLELRVLMPPKFLKKGANILLAAPLIINDIIYLSAPFTGHLVFWYAKDYTFQRGPLGISVYVVTFFYLILLVLRSVKAFHQNDKSLSTMLLFIVGVAVLTGTLEALNLIPGYIDEAFVLGVLVFYVYLITINESRIRTDLMRSELERSKSELTLLRRQIKPHFVFNALSNIKSLIRQDPDKAVLKLEDFSEYLRANLDNMNTETLVTFEDELANVEAYVSLALADENKGIDVIYDIKERYFRLPPLTIEPLLENSIQHGVAGGGTVKVSTYSTDDDFVVTVSDDGKGFTEDDLKNTTHRGIGIENVKTRIERLCKGSLDIESGDQGTTVTIKIPKQQGDE